LNRLTILEGEQRKVFVSVVKARVVLEGAFGTRKREALTEGLVSDNVECEAVRLSPENTLRCESITSVDLTPKTHEAEAVDEVPAT